MRTTTIVLVCILTTLTPCAALGETGKDYALMARATWSAFQCSALADEMQKSGEHERLFEYGLTQGRKFLAAIFANPDDIAMLDEFRESAPVGVLFVLAGPSADFVLGRIYESATQDVVTDVYKESMAPGGGSAAETAEHRFEQSNCRLVGS